MARDRKRAKQRQQRRPERTPASTGSEIHRADVPGALEHASGDVDEFDAALVRGAGGVPAPLEERPPRSPRPTRRRRGRRWRPRRPTAVAERQRRRRRQRRRSRPPATPKPRFRRRAPRERRQSLPRRAVGFLRASWAELQRVQWPDRPQVSQATAVVLGFVAVAGAYLGAADWVAQKIVNLILYLKLLARPVHRSPLQAL